jgi:mannose-1-phosphate guanylyltransferase/mannose-6-phosphate isomerase
MSADLLVTPVIITGGSGTRLWPVSRKKYPKQFVDLFDSGSLFQESCKRVKSEQFKRPIIMANSDHRFIVADQMQQVGVEPEHIILEPVGRNTAPAILIASLLACRGDKNALLLIMPSDHVITDAGKFRDDVRAGVVLASNGNIVTFGVKPQSANTAYGYIETNQSSNDIYSVKKFVEKPPLKIAEQYVKAGNYFWNAGIFLFSASHMIEAFKQHHPDMLKHCTASLDDAKTDLDFLRLEEEAFARCENISIDYAIIEKSSNIYCKPLSTFWNDLGSWDAMADQMDVDENGNSAYGDLTFHNSKNCFGYSDSGANISVVGMQDTVVVATKDAILVVARNSAEDVKEIVEKRRKIDRRSVETHNRVYRPWGWYESIETGERFQVKCLMVKPGGCLSLQSHRHRAEHWVTVSGTAKVTVGEEISMLAVNESIYVPLGAVHRLENPGDIPVLLIEVQSGSYLGEDDIVRYEDVYRRD